MNWDSRTGRLIERLSIGTASLVLSVGAIALLSGYFAGNDQAGITGTTAGPGQMFSDQGDTHLPPGRLQPAYDSDPPTSGPHVVEPVTADDQELNDNQLLSALELGNVVFVYGSERPPAGLSDLARSIAGQFAPVLSAAGAAVILSRRPGTVGIVALAWTHMLTVSSAADPRLAQFARFWLGNKRAPSRSLPSS